jgi:hypothetical protein
MRTQKGLFLTSSWANDVDMGAIDVQLEARQKRVVLDPNKILARRCRQGDSEVQL